MYQRSKPDVALACSSQGTASNLGADLGEAEADAAVSILSSPSCGGRLNNQLIVACRQCIQQILLDLGTVMRLCHHDLPVTEGAAAEPAASGKCHQSRVRSDSGSYQAPVYNCNWKPAADSLVCAGVYKA
jgi:hypothetical protein